MFDSFLKTIVHHGYTLIGCVIEVANSFERRDKTSIISGFSLYKFGRYLVKKPITKVTRANLAQSGFAEEKDITGWTQQVE